jgi:hypothetical protein
MIALIKWYLIFTSILLYLWFLISLFALFTFFFVCFAIVELKTWNIKKGEHFMHLRHFSDQDFNYDSENTSLMKRIWIFNAKAKENRHRKLNKKFCLSKAYHTTVWELTTAVSSKSEAPSACLKVSFCRFISLFNVYHL